METNIKSPHGQYKEAYVGILNAYQEQLKQSVVKKNELKDNFFKCIKNIMYFMVVTFGIVVIFSLIIMGLMIIFESISTEIVSGTLLSIISSFVTMILAIYKLPQIIADYLFNKEEDKQMTDIIINIQKYELDADKTEKMREQANIDAAMRVQQNDDSEMADLTYVDLSTTDNQVPDSQVDKNTENIL